ncbi:hypothetical protein Hanom_Chr09g00795131 [Helianthus anomalus]
MKNTISSTLYINLKICKENYTNIQIDYNTTKVLLVKVYEDNDIHTLINTIARNNSKYRNSFDFS